MPKIFTLKQVVSSIRKTIEDRYQHLYWVKAEMHKLNRFPSGHCFPELLQKDEGKIVAQISGSIWKHNFDRINQKFINTVKEPLKEDTTLLLQVKINFHETYGLSLQIQDIDPNYTLGELQKERQATLKKLNSLNLLNRNQLLNFPLLPKRIAIISAESSKGLSDFMQVIERNEWNYNFFHMLFPAYLQGDHAANSIVKQLNQISRVKEHFDLVVIVRGGGGEVGLSCYNNFSLCEAIATFPIPVLTGIGHSTNLTVAEMVSYRNAITPTELGDFLIQAFHEFSIPVQDAYKQIKRSSLICINEAKQSLTGSLRLFKQVSGQAVMREQHYLLTTSRKFKSGVRLSLQRHKEIVDRLTQNIKVSTRSQLKEQGLILHNRKEQIPRITKSVFQKAQQELNHITHSVQLMDPINVLKRGYSITTINGKTISPENPANQGSTIQTKTASFALESKVELVKDNPPDD
ncbi:MAG: exodeoxyribonuclease VII large subunit [Crocinitomicaceae bacterium]|nr:exodeoxyribonuclease VII large subunit [Crocinitomicaceae bacterium]